MPTPAPSRLREGSATVAPCFPRQTDRPPGGDPAAAEWAGGGVVGIGHEGKLPGRGWGAFQVCQLGGCRKEFGAGGGWAEAGGRAARASTQRGSVLHQLAAHRAARLVAGMDVDVEIARHGDELLRRGLVHRHAGLARRIGLEGDDRRPGHPGLARMDVRHGQRGEVGAGEGVAQLALPDVEAAGEHAGPVSVARPRHFGRSGERSHEVHAGSLARRGRDGGGKGRGRDHGDEGSGFALRHGSSPQAATALGRRLWEQRRGWRGVPGVGAQLGWVKKVGSTEPTNE